MSEDADTGDIDFVYRRTKGNVRRLCMAMLDFGAPQEVVDEEALMTPDIVTQFGHPPYRIDLLNAIDGVTFDRIWKGAGITRIAGYYIRVIGLNELRKNKAATGRQKDKDDLRRLDYQQTRKKK
jgi:predicted nucleotidyltransferase